MRHSLLCGCTAPWNSDLVRSFTDRRRLGWLLVPPLLFTLLWPLAPARGGQYTCNPDEVVDAAKAVYETVPKSCSTQASNPVFYGLTAFMIAATQTPQGKAFCDGVQDVKSAVQDFQSKLTKAKGYWDLLSDDQKEKIKALLPSVADELSGAASEASEGLGILSCACIVAQWQAPADLYVELGTCFADGLCQTQDWLHEHVSSKFSACTGPPPEPPKQIDCRPDPHYPLGNGFWDMKADVPWVGDTGQCGDGWNIYDATGHKVGFERDKGFVCNGSICYSNGLLKTGSGNYCFCPPAMQQAQSPGMGECWRYLTCACPTGTKPLSGSGAGAYICICDSTGQPVGDDGKCPKPLTCNCSAGEVVLAKDLAAGKCTCGCPDNKIKVGSACVAACASNLIMTSGGTCCSPASTTSCGTCCPVSTKPSADGSTCVSLKAPKSPPNSTPVPLKPIKF